MDEYPDPDEEYELMYADELEMLNEEEGNTAVNITQKKVVQAKRSLDFTSPTIHEASVNHNDMTTFNTNSQPISNTNNLQSLDGSNKRTYDEIFGDISDIDFTEQLPKKKKTEEEVNLELINLILERRKIRQLLSAPKVGSQSQRQSNYNAKENLSLDIPRWSFIPLTNCEGDRIYVRLQSEESWQESLNQNMALPSLHASYVDVWEEARKIVDSKLEAESRHMDHEEALPDMESETELDDGNLWVERYKPNSYVDLLSEEPVNRSVLHWLHLWDKVVFKKEIKGQDPQQRNTFVKRTGQFQFSNKWKGKKTEPVEELDADGRPHHKVVLLCGPPGVGKTTLAHLLGRLAGYRTVELNASDERSVESFRTALQNATLMQSVLDVERRPNCLVLDEIDGAPLPTVELLVKWCTATAAEGKKKGKSQPLKRPVIAICNDLYAPALRPLRAVAQIVYVNGVTAQRLASRLKTVCTREGLTADSHILLALATRVQGDVRAAFSLLQFIKTKAKTEIQMDDVTSTSIGEKDCHKGILQALQAIFTTNFDSDPYNAVLKTVNAAGEYDRVIEGIFENYITDRDTGMAIAGATLQWLRLYDIVNSWTMRNQNYSLYSLLPICAASCYTVVSTRYPGRVKFPMQAQEVNRKATEMRNILESVCRGTSPSVLPSSRRALHLDLVALLPYILAPRVRSGNVQLCSENERKALSSAASTMCDYGLQYIQQRGLDGLYNFVLEPDIYKIAFFGSEERVRVQPTIRQAISREQQLEQIRRLEMQTAKVPNKESEIKRVAVATTTEAEKKLPNHLQRLQPKDIKKSTPQVQKDFFGRVVPISENVHRPDAVRDLISSSSVIYQYREGFNNAVRRSVRIQDLL